MNSNQIYEDQSQGWPGDIEEEEEEVVEPFVPFLFPSQLPQDYSSDDSEVDTKSSYVPHSCKLIPGGLPSLSFCIANPLTGIF